MQEHDLTRAELNYCYQRMKAHAEQTERRLRDWDAGFRSWIIKAIHDGEIGPEAKSRNSKGGSGTAFDF